MIFTSINISFFGFKNQFFISFIVNLLPKPTTPHKLPPHKRTWPKYRAMTKEKREED